MNCLHLRDPLPDKRVDGHQLYECAMHGRCTAGDCQSSDYPACATCGDRVALDDPTLADRYVDTLLVTDRTGSPTDALRGMLAGGPAFLICGGPSAQRLPLELLQQRNVWSMSVNNMAAHVRTDAFVCSDPPSKFHEGIWRDKKMMKFVPTPKLRRGGRGRLRRKLPDGGFAPLEIDGEALSTADCPNVWGFARRAWFQPDYTFFSHEATWGNHKAGTERTGEPKTVCTMLLGLRLLYYLGARRIYLVGVDFYMDPDLDLLENYAFDEERDEGACASNNSQFRVVNGWLCKMVEDGVFEQFGLQIYNCNAASGLRAFAHVPFGDAIADARRDWPDEPLDTKGWYSK